MKLKFAFLNLFLGCISLFIINTKFISNAKGEELLKVELHNEIKKGKFLINKKRFLLPPLKPFARFKILFLLFLAMLPLFTRAMNI